MSFQSNIIGLCATAVVLLIPPLAWHSQSKNIPAIILITWLLLMDVTFLISAAIWSGEEFATRWSGKGWCDIITKLQVGANVGIACAVTTIVSNLHIVLKADSVIPEVNSWKKICRDLVMCLATPITVMALSYIVQLSRFGIGRYYGCTNLLSPTWVTTVLYTMWALIWSAAAAVYATLVLVIFYRKRKDVRDILHCTNSKLNLTRFSRLLIFCFLIILVIFPLAVYAVVEDIRNLTGTYSFKQTHQPYMWRTIIKFDQGKSFASVWLYILMSLMVFFIFGLGTDALHLYSNFLKKIKLGFMVTYIEDSIQKHKDNRVANILSKLASSTESQDSSFSDSSLEKGSGDYSTYQSSTLGSRANFYIDYSTPNDKKARANAPFRSDLSSIFKCESKNTSTINHNVKDAPLSTIVRSVDTNNIPDDFGSHSFSDCFEDDKKLRSEKGKTGIVSYIFNSDESREFDVTDQTLPDQFDKSQVKFHYKVQRKE
ncbi:hypothetical protein HG535_0H03520 [Zygotorulaspora mrakii]|uniref:Uncharacterized protein n=1 Tax=Zygotorulaspora mrakii TaxID=42260 RepID=A0A7H9B8L0_ZYGMR|nr:uncharacterized protein HG535_0H03520 [Zygotorulaspora mrakii]QLG75025.1 hypothetical protein HG535_0H03520 [Zygotorulaspora mrakii]